jgi:hypothetical protein
MLRSAYLSQYHTTNAPYSSSSTRSSYQKDKRAKPGNLTKSRLLSEKGENCIGKYFYLFFMLQNFVSWHRWTIAALSSRRSGLYTATVPVTCGEQSRTEKFFSPSTSVASYKYHPHTNVNRSATLIERKCLRNLGNYTQSNALSDIGKHWAETYFHIVYALGG